MKREHRQKALISTTFSTYLGNVRSVIGDTKWNEGNGVFLPAIISYTNYYPFGMAQAGRSHNSADYKFGYNGKEKDDEIKGSGNSYDYGFRMYDSRVAKFLSIDPLKDQYPWFSPFQFAGNTPIQAIDLDGLEQLIVNKLSEPTADQPGKALITIVLDYKVVTAGTGTVVDINNKINREEIYKTFAKGNTEFNVNILPSKTMEMQTVGIFEGIWNFLTGNNNYYNVNIKYEITLSNEQGVTYEQARDWMFEDPIARGIVLFPPGFSQPVHKASDPAGSAWYLNSHMQEQLAGFLGAPFYPDKYGAESGGRAINPYYICTCIEEDFAMFNVAIINPLVLPGTLKINDMSESQVIAHEMGHNLAYLHYHDKERNHYMYDHIGLSSNRSGIYPTRRNTKTIINDEYNHSKIKETTSP